MKLSDKFAKKNLTQQLEETETSMKVNEYIEKIIEETGVSKQEIMRQVESKKEELKGLISTEGALFIIAKEFGVEITKNPLKPKESVSDLFDDPQPKKEIIPKEIKAKIKANAVKVPDFNKPKEAPKIPTEQEITKKQKELDPNKQYPMITIKPNDPLLAQIEVQEQQRIIDEINKLKFAVESALTDKGDYYNQKPTRQGCHKLQTIFNLSTEIKEEKYWQDDNGQWIAKYIVRAITTTGRYAEAMGLCEQNEKGKTRTMMDTLATAQTRAENRAILNIIGFGQVSAEEMGDGDWLG